MAETYFPERLRCKTCRKNLSNVVLDGLYCSYRCARLPEPSSRIDDAPRHCKRFVDGVWGWKTKYTYEGAVPVKYRNDPSTNIYRCDYCRFLHIGHNRIQEEPERLRRVVPDMKTLGSVVRRYREQKNIDKKTLAKALNIPVVRITEIEEGNKEVKADVLFKVLNKLWLSVEISGK